MGQSDHDTSAAEKVRDLDQLEEVFRSVEKPKAAYRIGIEVEKFGVRATDGAPLGYDGDHGVLRVLQALADRHGWAPQSETPGGPVIPSRAVRARSRSSPARSSSCPARPARTSTRSAASCTVTWPSSRASAPRWV